MRSCIRFVSALLLSVAMFCYAPMAYATEVNDLPSTTDSALASEQPAASAVEGTGSAAVDTAANQPAPVTAAPQADTASAVDAAGPGAAAADGQAADPGAAAAGTADPSSTAGTSSNATGSPAGTSSAIAPLADTSAPTAAAAPNGAASTAATPSATAAPGAAASPAAAAAPTATVTPQSATPAAATSTQVLPNGTYKIASAKDPSQVIDVPGYTTAKNAVLEMWRQNNGDNQYFTLTYVSDASGGYYTIRSVSSGLAFSTRDAQDAAGSPLVQAAADGSATQRFALTANADGTYTLGIRPDSSTNTKGLVFSAAAQDGASINLAAANGSAGQKFIITPDSRQCLADGVYRVSSSSNSSLVWDVPGFSGASATALGLWQQNNGDNQYFQFTYAGGFYTIKSLSSGLVLQMASPTATTKSSLTQTSAGPSTAQLFIITPNPDGTMTISTKAAALDSTQDLVLTAAGQSAAGINQAVASGAAEQKFVITADGRQVLSNGIYQLASAKDSGQVLDVAGFSAAKGLPMELWQQNNGDNQYFELSYANGYYTVRSLSSGLYLEVLGPTSTKGQLVQNAASKGDAQEFVITKNADGSFTLTTRATLLGASPGLVLNTAAPQNGAGIGLASHSTAATQRFIVTPDTREVALGADSAYRLTPAGNSALCLDVNGQSTLDNASIIAWTYWGGLNEKFMPVRTAKSTYAFAAMHSGGYLTVSGGKLVQQGGAAAPNKYQAFTLVRAVGGLRLYNAATGDYVSVSAAGALSLTKSNASTHTLFSVNAVPLATSGTYGLYTPTGTFVSILLGNTAGGTASVLAAKSTAPAQVWTATVDGSGNMKLINCNSYLSLDITGQSKADGTAVIQWDYWGGANQTWTLVPASGGWFNLKSGLGTYVASTGGSTAVGATLVTTQNKASALKLRLKPLAYQNPAGMFQVQVGNVVLPDNAGYNLNVGCQGLKVVKVRLKFGYIANGPYTTNIKNAVMSWQASHGLPATGVTDYKTWISMGFSDYDWYNLGSYVTPNQTTLDTTRQDHINIMINTAKAYLGTAYADGSAGPPGSYIDCSGLTIQCMYASGIDPGIRVSPNLKAQYLPGYQDSSTIMFPDTHYQRVPYAARQPGDLVFYQSNGQIFHVALYIGNDQVIDAWPPQVMVRPIKDVQRSDIAGILRVFN